MRGTTLICVRSCIVSEFLHNTCIQLCNNPDIEVLFILYVYCIFYSHCPHAVVASRSMTIVVDPRLKLIMFLFLSCNVLCSQCSLSP